SRFSRNAASVSSIAAEGRRARFRTCFSRACTIIALEPFAPKTCNSDARPSAPARGGVARVAPIVAGSAGRIGRAAGARAAAALVSHELVRFGVLDVERGLGEVALDHRPYPLAPVLSRNVLGVIHERTKKQWVCHGGTRARRRWRSPLSPF